MTFESNHLDKHVGHFSDKFKAVIAHEKLREKMKKLSWKLENTKTKSMGRFKKYFYEFQKVSILLEHSD